MNIEAREELVLNVLEGMDDAERLELFEDVRMLFCVFCGRHHPHGRLCLCWDSVSSEKIAPLTVEDSEP